MPLPAILCFCLQPPGSMTASATPPVSIASFGIPDTLFLVVLALIVFGPKKLPEISRQIGKLLYEFRKASNDFKFQIEEELRASEQAERQKQLTSQAATPQPATPIAIAAGETVSAEPVPEGLPAAESVTAEPATAVTLEATPSEAHANQLSNTGTPAQPSIQPPASGLPVSSRSPYRASEEGRSTENEGTSEVTAAGESLDEMQANAQEAVRSAAADPSSHQPGDVPATDPIPTHHG